MNLLPTTNILRARSDATAATTEPSISVASKIFDTTTKKLSELGSEKTPLTGTSNVTIAAAVATGRHKQVTDIVIVNRDSTARTITIEEFDGSTAYPVHEVSLLAGEKAEYNEGTWEKYTTTGSKYLPVAEMLDNDGLTLDAVAVEPATPASGKLILYSKSIAGRVVPKAKGPSGVDYSLQASFWQNNTCLWTPTTATAGLWQGTAGAGTGTYSTALPTTTNLYTAMKRARWANVVTTLNQVLGQRNTEAMFSRGNSTDQGGFFFFARCGFDVWTNGGRFFAGMHTGTTVISAEPSALNNTAGFAVDAADNGAIHFLTRDGSAATKAPTGFTIVTNRGYDLFMFCSPASSSISWRIVDVVAGTEASGTATGTLPVSTTMLTVGVLASNAALTTATSIQLGVNRIYVETDR